MAERVSSYVNLEGDGATSNRNQSSSIILNGQVIRDSAKNLRGGYAIVFSGTLHQKEKLAIVASGFQGEEQVIKVLAHTVHPITSNVRSKKVAIKTPRGDPPGDAKILEVLSVSILLLILIFGSNSSGRYIYGGRLATNMLSHFWELQPTLTTLYRS